MNTDKADLGSSTDRPESLSTKPGGHTPGPWFVDEWNRGSLTVRSDDSGPIAELPDWIPEHKEEERANARLIAAAPELLEAIKLARDYVHAELIHRQDAYDGYPHKWSAELEDLAMVDRAIAKATA